MVEDDLDISELIDLDFVNHHHSYCSNDPRACREKGLSWFDAAALFLSRLAAEKISLPAKLWTYPDRLTQFRRSPESAMKTIKGKLGPRLEFSGTLTANSPESTVIGRAILHAYANTSLRSDITALAALFRSREDAIACCSALINSVTQPPPPS